MSLKKNKKKLKHQFTLINKQHLYENKYVHLFNDQMSQEKMSLGFKKNGFMSFFRVGDLFFGLTLSETLV